MRCPQCGQENPIAARFCNDCGQPLRGAPLSPPAPGSYTPRHLAEKILTSKAALEGERKQVTVLFADLKGSMELLADRDPEDARKVLDPVIEHMMAAVHRYEGTVNQVMGDGIMALFGASRRRRWRRRVRLAPGHRRGPRAGRSILGGARRGEPESPPGAPGPSREEARRLVGEVHGWFTGLRPCRSRGGAPPARRARGDRPRRPTASFLTSLRRWPPKPARPRSGCYHRVDRERGRRAPSPRSV